MTDVLAHVAAARRALTRKAPLRATLLAQAGGDWERITLDADGGFTVHNNVRQALRSQERAATAVPVTPPAPPALPAPRVASAPVKSARKPARVEPERPPARPLRVITPREETRPTGQVLLSPAPAPEVVRDFDWASVDLESTASRLRDRFRLGVPPAIQYTYSDDVLALFGLDLDMMDAALRHPQRVELRPETFEKSKGYPVLAFYRGDVNVILGLRTPTTPKVIAAYATALLEHDSHRVGHTGGGGAKAKAGLPKNPRQVINALRARGAFVPEDCELDKVVEVTYRGTCLGKINLGSTVDRKTSESDYQRCLRKMQGIDGRSAARVG